MRKSSFFGKTIHWGDLLIVFLALMAVFSPLFLKLRYVNHYYYLSKSLVAGKVSLNDELGKALKTEEERELIFDFAYFEGKYYLHLGLFPAIAGIPFLIFGRGGHLAGMLFFWMLLVGWMLRAMVRHLGERKVPLKQLSLVPSFLMIASPILTILVRKGPWHLTALMAMGLGFLFVWFYVIQGKNWAIGLLVPLFLTRPTTIFYSVIPFVDSLKPGREANKKAFVLILTLALGLSIFFFYNYLRFGNILEFGYRPEYHLAYSDLKDYQKARKLETSLKEHFLSNAFYMFLNPPRANLNEALRFVFPYFEVSPFGAGLLFVMPWFLIYFFFIKKAQIKKDWPYWLAVTAIAVAVFFFKSEGNNQIGSRYAADFFPLLAFVFLRWLFKNKQAFRPFKKILTLSVGLNIYFFFLYFASCGC
jgi:hypothetical protein